MTQAHTFQTPEQKARASINALLEQAGWKVQHKKKIDLSVGPGIAIREYDTDVGPVRRNSLGRSERKLGGSMLFSRLLLNE